MKLHELIDREEPKCLYCNSLCDYRLDGFGVGLVSHDVDILTCQKCKEIFEVHTTTNAAGEATIDGMSFSCKDLVVVCSYEYGYAIGGKEYLYPMWSTNNSYQYLEPFPVDFSNKKKLYKKLKTYLVFS